MRAQSKSSAEHNWFLTCQPLLASNVLPITNRRYGRLKICATLNTGKRGLPIERPGNDNFCSHERILLESTQSFRTIRRVLNGWERIVFASTQIGICFRLPRVVAMMALAALAGCSSSSGLPSRLTRVPNTYGEGASLPGKTVRPTNSWVTPSIDREPPGIVAKGSASHDEILPVPPSAIPRAPTGSPIVNDWVSLERWTETNHLSAPQRLLSATHLTYELHTAGGVI